MCLSLCGERISGKGVAMGYLYRIVEPTCEYVSHFIEILCLLSNRMNVRETRDKSGGLRPECEREIS